MYYCSKCGKEVLEGSSFCQHCGGSLSATPSSMQTSSVSSGLTNEDFKAFVGNNSEKYLGKFAKFNEGGIDNFKATWHWPAFFVPFAWLLYRKSYGWAILAFFLGIIPFVGVVAMFGWAIVANYMYYKHAKRKLLEIKQLHSAPETQKDAITVTGGVSIAALIIGEVIRLIAVIGILLASIAIQSSANRVMTYNAAAMADLRNAAIAEEVYYTDNQKYDAAALTDGATYGFQNSANVTVTVTSANTTNYTITSTHSAGNLIYTLTGPGGTMTNAAKP